MEPSELVRRGEETYKRVYEGELRAHLEATALGKYCVLDIETGEHLIADTAEEFRSHPDRPHRPHSRRLAPARGHGRRRARCRSVAVCRGT